MLASNTTRVHILQKTGKIKTSEMAACRALFMGSFCIVRLMAARWRDDARSGSRAPGAKAFADSIMPTHATKTARTCGV